MLVLFRYYAFHDVFVREVLGKKLSKGTKKDLDDISAKTGVTLKSCRRQVTYTQPLSILVVLFSYLLDTIRMMLTNFKLTHTNSITHFLTMYVCSLAHSIIFVHFTN